MAKEAWITAGTAAKILEERFGRPVRVDYVTKLGKMNRLRTKHMESRIVLYNRNDVEQVQIKSRAKPSRSVENAALVLEESTSAMSPQGTSEGEKDHVKEASEPEAA